RRPTPWCAPSGASEEAAYVHKRVLAAPVRRGENAPIIWSARAPSPSRRARSRSGGGRFFAQGLEAAAGLLDRRGRALRGRRDLETRFRLQLARAEDLDAVARMRDDAGLHQAFERDRLVDAELARVDRALDAAEIDLVIDDLRRRGEAELRQAPMQRHLAALEALHAHARARSLALAAAARLLALARADPAPDADARLRRAGIVFDFVEFHGAILLPVDDAHEVRDLGDHAAVGGRVGHARAAADPVEAEA